jgi:hypothetical protein
MTAVYIALAVTIFGGVVGSLVVWATFRFPLPGDERLSPSGRRQVMKVCYAMMWAVALIGGAATFIMGVTIH